MTLYRFSQRIDITIDTELLREVDASAMRYHTSRSALIRWALLDWLERHPALEKRPQPKSKYTIDITKPFNELIQPDMSPDEMLEMLQEYETAYRNQV